MVYTSMDIKLRFDGRYDWIPGENRSWTIMNHFIDQDGADRFKGTGGLEWLISLGVVKEAK